MKKSIVNKTIGRPMHIAPGELPFVETIWKHYRRVLLWWAAATFGGFFIFKLLYPFPDLFSDSYSYIFAALTHLDANVWPIGYSKFLLFFHGITHSHQALVWVQYCLLAVSLLYLYCTILYFFPVGRPYRRILFAFFFCNPLFFYLSNYVSSDSLFAAISIAWVTQLIWIVQRPRLYQVVAQGVLLFIAFTFRYNAMYYPLIALLAVLLSSFPKWAKATGLLFGPLLIIPFILHSREAARQLTGTPQFPILSGWQWGNNALYMREHIDVDPGAFPTPETAELDKIAVNFFQHTPPEKRDLFNYVANYFIREKQSPLKTYLHTHYRIKDEYTNIMAWGMASPIFGQYGKFLAGKYPLSYFRYFLLMNTKNYFLPPLEKLEVYNLGQDNIWGLGAFWFSMSNPKMWSVSKYLQGGLLLAYPFVFLVLNLLFAGFLVRLLYTQGFQGLGKGLSRLLVLFGSLLLLNLLFSVAATIAVIRYQVFPMVMLFAIDIVLLDAVRKSLPRSVSAAGASTLKDAQTNLYAAGN